MVTKRNGVNEPFSKEKIKKAIKKAFRSAKVKQDIALIDDIANNIKAIEKERDLSVEEIHDMIEERLIEKNCKDVAKEYIIYRKERDRIKDFVEKKEEFIRKYKESDNNANATIDDNSNVSSKNIATLNNEIHKVDNVHISRYMIKNKLKTLFPDFDSKQYIRDLENHIIYKHDESSFSGAISPYSYAQDEVLLVVYNGNRILVSFEELYNLLEEKTVVVEKGVEQKYPQSLFVLDRGAFTKVSAVTKKKRKRNLVLVSCESGESLLVTDNHPMIVDKENIDNTIEAINCIGKEQHKINTLLFTTEENSEDLRELGKKLAEIVVRKDAFVDIKEDEQQMLNENGFIFGEDNLIPINILDFEKDFVLGYLENIIHSFQSISQNNEHIKYTCLFNRSVFLKIANIERFLGHKVVEESFPTEIGILSCMKTQTEPNDNSQFDDKNKSIDLDKTIVTNTKVIDSFSFIPYVYDITTETRTFALNNILVHNCVSTSMYQFLTNGMNNIGGISKPPKNIDSYCGELINFVFMVSSQFAGAVAVPEALVYFDYFARKEWGDDYYLHSDTCTTTSVCKRQMTILKEIYQYFQQIIYSINQPSGGRGMQAAFVNFSYFDSEFFKGMFENFYFPDGTQPTWDSVNWLQKTFIRWFNNERTKALLTFPVESFAFVSKDGDFVDKENADFAAEMYAKGHSFFTYISDTVDSLSSCCFEGSEVITVKQKNGDKEGVKNIHIEDFVQSFIDDNINALIFEADITKDNFYIESYNVEKNIFEETKITGVLKKEYNGKMYVFDVADVDNVNNNSVIHVTAEHPILVIDTKEDSKRYQLKRADEVSEDITRYLVAYCKNGVVCTSFIRNCTIENREKKLFVYDIELEKNHLFVANNIVTHNCRLKNKIQTKEFSMTNGNIGIMTGSKSVITLNLNRIIQNWSKSAKTREREDFYETFAEYLIAILDRVYKYHTAYNELLWDMYDAKLLPIYRAGFINLDKQYLTIGINGLNEAAEFMGLECVNTPEYEKFCNYIFDTISSENAKHKTQRTTFNTECVPAESLAIKNYNWDKNDGYEVPNDRNLYASYIFKPSDSSVSVLEKMELHGGNYIDKLDGGSACHINLEEHLTKNQYKKLLKHAIKTKCSYFTFNIPNSKCKSCGKIFKAKIDTCPECGSTDISLYDRVIGYLTEIKNWSSGRQEEQKTRVYQKKETIDEELERI